MKIEVGQVFTLTEYPKIVGVVTGVKDAKGDSWYVQTSLGDRIIWNNKSQTWRGETEFNKLTELTELVSAGSISACCSESCCEECEDCTCEESDSDTQPIDINIGEKWVTEDGQSVLIVSIDESGDDIVYTGVVILEEGVDIGLFDRYGKDMLDVYVLDYLEDTLFESWELC